MQDDAYPGKAGHSLGDVGFRPDPGGVWRRGEDVVIFHYTRAKHVRTILAPHSGLIARRKAGWSSFFATEGDPFIIEAFLEPFPSWLRSSPYFGDLGWQLMCRYIGDVLLEIRLPSTSPDVYVADYAHTLECKHVNLRGRSALGLGYDCRTGHQVVRADRNSYVPFDCYGGGHLAPVVTMVRSGPGLVIPSSAIRIADVQPLAEPMRD